MKDKLPSKSMLWDLATQNGLTKGLKKRVTSAKALLGILEENNVQVPDLMPDTPPEAGAEQAVPETEPIAEEPAPTPDPIIPEAPPEKPAQLPTPKKPLKTIVKAPKTLTDIEQLRLKLERQERLIVSLKQQRDAKALELTFKQTKLNNIEKMLRERKYPEEILGAVNDKPKDDIPRVKARVKVNRYTFEDRVYLKDQLVKVPITYFPTSSLELLEPLPGDLAKLQKPVKK